MKADVTGVCVEKPACQEAAILGDALMAGKVIGIYQSYEEAVARTVRVEREFDPNPALRPAYDEAYARYKDLVQRNFGASK